jgi:hypothetical protein
LVTARICVGSDGWVGHGGVVVLPLAAPLVHPEQHRAQPLGREPAALLAYTVLSAAGRIGWSEQSD